MKYEPLSREFLLKRGHCCDNKCKNCPYKPTKMIKFLKWLSDIVDPNYWASKISKKTGLEEKARNSKFRKWEAGLTGWKHWAWQIGGGILFFIIFEYLINFIGLTMIPW